jgi:O-antigen/teichoic acid export membrane protein
MAEVTAASAPTAPAEAGRGARTVVVLAAAEFMGKVGTLALLIYAVRALTPAEFGSFSYALAFGLLLAALPTWGLDALMVQQTGADRSRLASQYGQLLVLRTVLAVPVLVAGVAFGLATRPTAADRFALAALLVAAVLESYAQAPRAIGGVLRRQSSLAVLLILQRVLTLVTGIAVLVAGLGLAGLSAAYLMSTFLGTAVLFVAVDRMGARPSWAVTRTDLRLTARKSIPLGVDALMAMVMFRADAILLGWFHGDEEVAQYAAPFRVVETVLFLTWAVSRVIYPAMAAALDRPAQRLALTRGLAVVAFVFTPFTAFALVRPEDLLALLFGDYYADTGATTLRLLAIVPLLFAMGYLIGSAFIAAGRSRVSMTTSLVAVSTGLGAKLVLLPPLGSHGAALTTTGVYLLDAAFLIVMARRYFGQIGLAAIFALPALAVLPAAAVAAMPVHVVPAVALAGCVYVLVWWVAARRWQPEQAAVLIAAVQLRSEERR